MFVALASIFAIGVSQYCEGVAAQPLPRVLLHGDPREGDRFLRRHEVPGQQQREILDLAA